MSWKKLVDRYKKAKIVLTFYVDGPFLNGIAFACISFEWVGEYPIISPTMQIYVLMVKFILNIEKTEKIVDYYSVLEWVL